MATARMFCRIQGASKRKRFYLERYLDDPYENSSDLVSILSGFRVLHKDVIKALVITNKTTRD